MDFKYTRHYAKAPYEAVTSLGYLLSLTDMIRMNVRPDDEGNEQRKNFNYSGETMKFATVITNLLFLAVHNLGT